MPYSDSLTHARRVDFSASVGNGVADRILYSPGTADNFSLITGYRYSGQVLQVYAVSDRYAQLDVWVQSSGGERITLGRYTLTNQGASLLLGDLSAAGLYLGGGASLGCSVEGANSGPIKIYGFAEERGNTRPIISGGGVGTSWGQIGGAIAQQEDLIQVLNAQAESTALEFAAIEQSLEELSGTTGPQGPPGADGAQGPQGLPGADGAQGPQGPPGADGAEGPQGPTGAQGPQGLPGPPGTDGAAGADGAQGPPGADGAEGPQGPPGADGAQGPQGPQGPQGADGTNGADGADGAQGPQGLPGLQGLPGPPGADGAQGPQGTQGPAGAQGPQGLPGLQGLPGPPGADGAQGPPAGATECDYYGATLPTAPTEGQTWRELTATGRIVRDWIRVNGIWVSREIYQATPVENFNRTASVTSNFYPQIGPLGCLARAAGYGLNMDQWNLQLSIMRLSNRGASTLSNTLFVGNQAQTIVGPWVTVTDVFRARVAVNAPATPTGIYGYHWLETRMIR